MFTPSTIQDIKLTDCVCFSIAININAHLKKKPNLFRHSMFSPMCSYRFSIILYPTVFLFINLFYYLCQGGHVFCPVYWFVHLFIRWITASTIGPIFIETCSPCQGGAHFILELIQIAERTHLLFLTIIFHFHRVTWFRWSGVERENDKGENKMENRRN